METNNITIVCAKCEGTIPQSTEIPLEKCPHCGELILSNPPNCKLSPTAKQIISTLFLVIAPAILIVAATAMKIDSVLVFLAFVVTPVWSLCVGVWLAKKIIFEKLAWILPSILFGFCIFFANLFIAAFGCGLIGKGLK